MAMRVDSRPKRMHNELTRLIDAYVSEAGAGRTPGPSGGPYTAAGLRRLRTALALVEAATGTMDLAAVDAMDAAELQRLAEQVVDHAGVRPSRVGSVVDALRGLASYATWGRPADPPVWATRARRDPGATSTRLHDTQTRTPTYAREERVRPPKTRTPTYTMLALGAQVSVWIERIIVIAFVLTAIGLALALA